MWRILKIIGSILKGLFWLAVVLLVACMAVLYLLERGLPAPLLHRLESALSDEDRFVRIERATFSLKQGARLHRVKVFQKRVAAQALVSVDEIVVDLALSPGLDTSERVRGVTLKQIVMPDLPPEQDEPQELPELPVMVPFPLKVEQADILGIKADRLTATVSTSSTRIDVTEVVIHLPNPSFKLQVDGQVTIDLQAQRVYGRAQGQAFPDNLMPLFRILKARGAIEQISCFTGIKRPVDAHYTFDVDIETTDFAMRLDLDVGPCTYRTVPIAFARGTLGIYGTNIYTSVVIDPFNAQTADGAPIQGRLAYIEEVEGLKVEADTTMDIPPLFTIINILNKGELDCVRCTKPPTLSTRGVVALSTTKSTVTNQLSGKVSFPAGSILNFEAREVTADFMLAGYQARFSNVRGTSLSGGAITGEVAFDFPEYAATAAVFNAELDMSNVALEEISQAFNVTNDRAGQVSGKLQLSGPLHERTVENLSGEGHVTIRNGVIHRMKIFAGLTDYLSRTIPGISSIVDQSSGSMDFTIRDGVLHTDNLLLEGNIFSISGKGTYNLATDKLDFTVRANIFKQKTIAGRITRLITLPFTRLLLEFKVFGKLENPDWSYVSIIEKITEGLAKPEQADAPKTETP
ncbi:MAG TPA: AsmA-like C-terminal region-containing protein [Candidatus Latescibacteria bacterium]|nr:AsmA-like C-terminal region-containing protein [Candidatus Latescibacterota bacterium]HRT29420.1 AsmA-like C-terminal region-containing protein [Kiritimatiellia bacterium]